MLALFTAFAAAPVAPGASPSQLLILGMHHSGTSVVSNLTMMMGAYGGEQDELLLHPENPLKFFERRDVVALDEHRLEAGVASRFGDRYEVPSWVAYGFDSAHQSATKVHEQAEAREIVSKLNTRRPWVTKDPRMCLVAEEWMPLLDAPMCLIVHREPLSVANSMMIYSHNVSLAEWASVYEAYYTNAMRACNGKPTVVVQHADLVADPYGAVKKLHADLTAAGVTGLTLPSEAQVTRLIKPSNSKPHSYLASERKVVGDKALAISKALTAAMPPVEMPSPASWLVTERKSKQAIATLLTTNNPYYLQGALVLGSSIRSFDSTRDMVALVTKQTPAEWRDPLQVAGWTIVEVDEIAEFWWGQCGHSTADQGERWGHMATKLRLWELTQYERVLYLDADTILTGPVDDVFASVSTFAAEKPKKHDHFNAGVLLLSPSAAVFGELMALGAQPHGNTFGNLIDCTEQGLLNNYFHGGAGREVTKLPVGRADVPADWSGANAPWAVHWITHVCAKPWLVAEGREPIEEHCDAVVYKYWQRVWDRLTASSKDESTAISRGSRESARRKMRRLTGVSAGASMVGRNQQKQQSLGELWGEVRDSIGRQLREGVRRELRRRRRRQREEYDSSPVMTPEAWAWVAIIGTLALGLAAGALLHKLFIKAPTEVGKGMTVVQAKRMGFQALGEGKGPIGVVSAVDDDDDDEDDDDDDEEEPPPKKGSKK